MRWQLILLVLFSFLVFSCETDLTDIGSSIQPASDAIVVGIDSSFVSSSNFLVDSIYSKPDSLLLGTFVDEKYGTVYADILTQLQPPLDVKFPTNAKPDSAKLIMSYFSWFGDYYSPLEVTVYKMDRNKTFTETGSYYSNINPAEYCTKGTKLGSKIFTAKDYGYTRTDTSIVEVKLSDSFKNDFAPIFKTPYTKNNELKFQEDFSGLYITTNFGTANMLNIRRVYMRYYYNYPVHRLTSKGADTIVNFSTYQDYPASEEVRTVNRFQLPAKKAVYDKFNLQSNINIISSPSNIYTNVTVPLNAILTKLNNKVGDKKLLINRAKFRVNVADVEDTTLAIPLVSSVMMMFEDKVDNYFKKRQLPSDTVSVIANISHEYDADNNLVYYYNFDLAKILTNEIKKKGNAPHELKFRLIPVSISYDGSSNIKEVKQQNLMRAVKLCSATHLTRPMRLDIVYSGF